MYRVYRNKAAAAYSSPYFFIFLSLQFSNIKISQELWGLEGYNLLHTWTMGVCIVCTGIRLLFLFVPLFFIFLSNFQTFKIFVRDFLGTLRPRNCFFFFLSHQLASIKNLHLQNCFNILWWLWPGVCELCCLLYLCVFVCVCKLFFSSKNSQELLRLGFWNLVQMLGMICYKRESATCCLSFPLLSIFLSLQ